MNTTDFKEVAYIQCATDRPSFSYTASTEAGKPGAVARLYFGGEFYEIPLDPVTGFFTWTAPQPVKDGEYSFSVAIVDNAQNSSAPLLATFIVDTTPPEAPKILSIYDNEGTESFFQPGGTSDDKTPTLTGIAQRGSTVFLKNDRGETIGSAVADKETGEWVITPTTELEDGANSLTLVAVEKFAKADRTGTPIEFVINVAADSDIKPGSVTIVDADDNVGNNQGPVTSGATTDDDTPTLRGTVIANQEVTIQYRQTGTSIWMTATATSNGTSWSWTPGTALAQGEWEFQALAGGNTSERFTLNINTHSDTSVTITHAIDNAGLYIGELANGALTDDTTPELHGRAEANSTVYLFYRAAGSSAWTALGTAAVGADGLWKATPDALTTGMVEFKATSSDNANAAGATFGLTLIVPGSNVPVITGAWDDFGSYQGLIKGGYTDDTTPRLSGIAEANSRVIIEYSSSGKTYSATVQAGKDGRWDFTPPELELGRWTFHAKTSEAGAWSEVYSLNIMQYEFIEKGEDFSNVTYYGNSVGINGLDSFVTANGLKIIIDHAKASHALITGGNVHLFEGYKPQYEIPPSHSFSLSLIKLDANGTLFVSVYNAAGIVIDKVEVNVDKSLKFTYETKNDELISGFMIESKIPANKKILIDKVEWLGVDVGWSNQRSWGDVVDYPYTRAIETTQTEIGDRATAIADQRLKPTATSTYGVSGVGKNAILIRESTNLAFDFRGAEEVAFDLAVYSGKSVTVNVYDVKNNLIEEITLPFDTAKKLENFHYSASNGELIGRVEVQPDGIFFFNNMKWKSAPDSLRPQETQILFNKDISDGYFSELIIEGIHLSSDEGSLWRNKAHNAELLYLHGKQNLQITLPEESNYINLELVNLNATSYVTFYNKEGMEIGRSGYGTNRIAFFASEGESISYFIVTNTNTSLSNSTTATAIECLDVRYIDEQPGYIKQFAFEDNSTHNLFNVDDLASHAIIGSEASSDTLKLTGKDQLLDLSVHPDHIKSVEIIDLTGTGDNTLRINLNAVLQHGEKDLFIEDGKTQMVVKGNEGDVVQLADILPEGSDISEWQHLDGTVTVAGVEYQVYSHGEDAELLVQQGVKTELI
jgi:hypothetical protein